MVSSLKHIGVYPHFHYPTEAHGAVPPRLGGSARYADELNPPGSVSLPPKRLFPLLFVGKLTEFTSGDY
jgi:hypothetical protein